MGSWTRKRLDVYKGQEGKVWNLMVGAWQQVGQEACEMHAGTPLLFLLLQCLLLLLLLPTKLNFSLSYGDLEERE